MSSHLGNQFIYQVGMGDLWIVKGLVLTDGSSVPLNINDDTIKDQDGDPLRIPNAVKSITKVANATGTYEILLSEPWFKCLHAVAVPMAPVNQATIVGTVAITPSVLVTLATQTLQTDADVGANFTTTFTNPTSTAQSVADQINAGNAGTSVFADIVNDAAGLSYLRVRSTTGGTTSTLAINAASTGDTTLGMSNVTATGQALGSMALQSWNPKGSGTPKRGDTAPLIDAQSITFVHSVSGVATALPSAGFSFELLLRNDNILKS